MPYDATNKIYSFATLEQYSAKQRFLIRVIGLAMYGVIRFMGWSLRMDDDDGWKVRADTTEVPVLCTWHDRMFASVYYFRDRGMGVMSSISFDAEYTARCLVRFGYGIIKGSSTRGGARGMIEMVREMRQGIPMAFTIDGPKGPRYEVKPGPLYLAKKTGNPAIAYSIETTRFWTLNSWDKQQIPVPFSRAKLFVADPIYVPADADENEIEAKLRELQAALDAQVERGREWRESLTR
ncbi:MAG: lysophospholipid acyltransferase family protein [Acidobacteria bacterium]|nr:lysophospholipid acyltransferase family protein [Acidobacteriota bacterium]